MAGKIVVLIQEFLKKVVAPALDKTDDEIEKLFDACMKARSVDTGPLSKLGFVSFETGWYLRKSWKEFLKRAAHKAYRITPSYHLQALLSPVFSMRWLMEEDHLQPELKMDFRTQTKLSKPGTLFWRSRDKLISAWGVVPEIGEAFVKIKEALEMLALPSPALREVRDFIAPWAFHDKMVEDPFDADEKHYRRFVQTFRARGEIVIEMIELSLDEIETLEADVNMGEERGAPATEETNPLQASAELNRP